MFWICNLVMGLCVAGAVYAGRDGYAQIVNCVESDLAVRFRSLHAPTGHLRSWIHVWVVFLAVLFFGLWLGAGALPFALATAAILAAGPWYLVRRIAHTRRQKLEGQLADAMVAFSSAVRAGLSLAQSLEVLAQDCPRPIQEEFAQIVGQYRMGKPLEETLSEAKERLKSENFVLFAAALLASRESGGRLNETVDRISKSVLELQRLERKVVTETAQARRSAVYMAIAPAAILAAYYFVDPVNTRLLFTTFPGQVLLSVAVVLNLAAYVWARKILNADI